MIWFPLSCTYLLYSFWTPSPSFGATQILLSSLVQQHFSFPQQSQSHLQDLEWWSHSRQEGSGHSPHFSSQQCSTLGYNKAMKNAVTITICLGLHHVSQSHHIPINLKLHVEIVAKPFKQHLILMWVSTEGLRKCCNNSLFGNNLPTHSKSLCFGCTFHVPLIC